VADDFADACANVEAWNPAPAKRKDECRVIHDHAAKGRWRDLVFPKERFDFVQEFC
jgi:hypothetical protein